MQEARTVQQRSNRYLAMWNAAWEQARKDLVERLGGKTTNMKSVDWIMLQAQIIMVEDYDFMGNDWSDLDTMKQEADAILKDIYEEDHADSLRDMQLDYDALEAGVL